MEHDPAIEVIVRTGTSTRPAQVNENENKVNFSSFPSPSISRSVQIDFSYPYPNRVQFPSYPVQFPTYPPPDFLDQPAFSTILNNSLRDVELKRHEEIDVDIEPRHAKTADLANECSICCKKFELGEKLSTLECGHSFHYPCLVEWGKYKPECPLCRKKIPIIER
jgi:hypothetical protein